MNTYMATVKQKLAFKKTLENGGSVSKAMRETKYNKSVAKNPKILTASKGWKELMDQYMPEDLLAKKHIELLSSVTLEKLSFTPETEDDEIKAVIADMPGYKFLYLKKIKGSARGSNIQEKIAYVRAPDTMTQDKALDKAYKLRGSYSAEKKDITTDGKPILDVGSMLLKAYDAGKD